MARCVVPALFLGGFLVAGCSSEDGSTGEGSASGGALGATGGSVASGGAAATTGGDAATGGEPASGGAVSTGGAAAGTGGVAGSGGAGSGGAGSGGVASTGGSTSTGGTGAGSGGTLGIDFSIWSLQLPVGTGTSPTVISPTQLAAGYSDEYFYIGDDAGQVFMDPATGIATSGSQHCRTEMREMKPNGSAAAWPSTGTNTMTVSGKVVQVGGGSSGHVTVAQVFNSTGSIPLCELEYYSSVGGFKLLYEEAKGAGTTVDLKTPVALDTPYSFTLALSNGVLTVSINGKEVYTKTPSAGVAGGSFYFKVGNYDQTALAGTASTTPYTVVEAYSVSVTHQ